MVRPPDSRQRGFTLIEMMVVVAIIGILVTTAVVVVRPARYAATVKGFCNEIAAEMDAARLRAVSSRRWQRLDIEGSNLVVHYEGDEETGMVEPSAYIEVRSLHAPGDISIYAVDESMTHLSPDDSVPSAGTGLGTATITFRPDGSSQAASIFVGDSSDKDRSRVVVFSATGASYVFDQW